MPGKPKHPCSDNFCNPRSISYIILRQRSQKLAAGVFSAAMASTVFAEGATAGVCWYNAADTFIANATATLNSIASADGTISVTTADSENVLPALSLW